jgi:hypothetical protein
MKILFLSGLFLILLFISCDNSTDTKDDYILVGEFGPSDNIQILEIPGEFKITIPANSLNGNLVLKIKKETSIPAFNVAKTKLGANVYKIKFTGNTTFSSPIKIIINYDKSQIPAGQTSAETIKGYVFANSNWKLGDFVIDEANSKIIFSVSDLATPKAVKDSDVILVNEGEVNFGDGYSTTDTGNDDELLAKMNYFISTLAFQCILDNDQERDLAIDVSNTSGGNLPKVNWNSNKFSIIQNDSTKYGYSKFNASGEINKSNMTLMNYKMQYIVFDNYSSMSTHLEEYNIQFNEIKGIENVFGTNPVWLTFSGVYNGAGNQSDFKNSIKTISYKITNYEVDGTTISNEQFLKSVNWNNYTNQINFNLYQVHN